MAWAQFLWRRAGGEINAAGYKMCRLLAGSRGTLAIIAQATLMVRPLPDDFGALPLLRSRRFPRSRSCWPASAAFPCVPWRSAAFRRPSCALASRHSGRWRLAMSPGFASVSEGSSVEVEWMLARLNEEWTAAGVASSSLPLRVQDDAPWRRIAELPADETINVLPSKLVETVAELLRSSPDCAIHAHAGDGVIHVSPTIEYPRLAAASTRRRSARTLGFPRNSASCGRSKNASTPRTSSTPELCWRDVCECTVSAEIAIA